MTLEFAPHQSYFIVFRRAANASLAAARGAGNFALCEPVQTVTGPWRVTFDPSLGGPAEMVFAELIDWSRHDDPGIRNYSGIAQYRGTLNVTSLPSDGAALVLDLGTVHNLARVRLNGHDLGVVWCSPWRVDVTTAVRSGGKSARDRSGQPVAESIDCRRGAAGGAAAQLDHLEPLPPHRPVDAVRFAGASGSDTGNQAGVDGREVMKNVVA